MILDAFQAGLSWRTVLHKEKFPQGFVNFDPKKIAKFSKKTMRDYSVMQELSATVRK